MEQLLRAAVPTIPARRASSSSGGFFSARSHVKPRDNARGAPRCVTASHCTITNGISFIVVSGSSGDRFRPLVRSNSFLRVHAPGSYRGGKTSVFVITNSAHIASRISKRFGTVRSRAVRRP